MLFRLPDSPTNASFLTDEEREIALSRLRSNKAGYKTNKINREQIVEAFIDPKTYMLALYILAANIPNGGFTTVALPIVSSLRNHLLMQSAVLGSHSERLWV